MGSAQDGVGGQMVEQPLLQAGAVSAALGPIVAFIAGLFHGGGDDPADLAATLPHYAANGRWEAVHIGQFLGFALMLGGLVSLFRSLEGGRGAAAARLGFATALVAIATYAANQAVDGVAIKFVAGEWLRAPAAEKGAALRVAGAVRHVEIGLSAFAELTLGMALLLAGLAIAVDRAYPRWLGWAAVATGVGWATLGLLVAHDGFTQAGLTMLVGALLALWMLALAVSLWRRSTAATARDRAAQTR